MIDNRRTKALRLFALRAAILACSAVTVFWLFYAADYYLLSGPGGPFADPFSRYFNFDPGGLSDTLASLAGINAAVFGIVFTVGSIIVQLSADRYTGVTRMFLRDRVNILVAAYYVVACVAGVWLAASLQSNYVPRLTLTMMLSLTTGGVVIMVPYFGYVFWFLEPENIVRRIRRDAVTCASKGAAANDAAACASAQAETIAALEELTDITSNSISGKDKIIASAAVDGLHDLAIQYLKVKSQASEAWFKIGPEIRLNPDFVAMDAESLRDLEARRTWVEWKVLRQYLSIYNEALTTMRDINYLIAIDTRYIGEAAAEAKDAQLIQLTFRYLNSFIRATLNARDVRTSYNVLNQYRKLAETMLERGADHAAIDAVRHMKYYGLISFEMGLSFVTETVAYDLSSLAQLANQLKSPAEKEILSEFLELDRPPFVRGEEKALMGVRKAQVKLAAYYLLTNQDDLARAIARDMESEPTDRLRLIRIHLETVADKDFWEITDRGHNFEYMPPEQRACLGAFFTWLGLDNPAPSAGGKTVS